MKATRRIMTVVALAAAASISLAGCAGGGNTGGGSSAATLTVWLDSNRAEALKDVISTFESENSVTVKVVQKDFSKIKDDFIQQAPTGKGPDVLIGAHDWLGSLVQNGVVAPLTISNTDDFEEVAVTAMSYEGQVYGLPVSIENIALIRNTDLDPNSHDTFDDLIATGQQLKAEGKVTYPFIVQTGTADAGDPYHLYPIQTSFGSPVFGTSADGSYDSTDLEIGNAGGQEFAAKLAQWAAEGVLTPNLDGDVAIEAFAGGQSPYIITGPWNLDKIKAAGFGYSIEGVPSAGGQPSQPFVGVQGFFVNATSKNSLLANKFVVDYMGSEEVQTALFTVGGRAPALKTAFDAAQSDPDAAAFGAVGANGAPQPSIPAMNVVWSDWGVTEGAIIGGKAPDPAAAWTTMSDGIVAKIAAG